MLWSGSYSSVDQASRRQLWACLLGCAFEGKMRKQGEGGVGRYGAGEVVGGRMVNRSKDDIVGLGYVLFYLSATKRSRLNIEARTRPLLCSTQMAFFF